MVAVMVEQTLCAHEKSTTFVHRELVSSQLGDDHAKFGAQVHAIRVVNPGTFWPTARHHGEQRIQQGERVRAWGYA